MLPRPEELELSLSPGPPSRIVTRASSPQRGGGGLAVPEYFEKQRVAGRTHPSTLPPLPRLGDDDTWGTGPAASTSAPPSVNPRRLTAENKIPAKRTGALTFCSFRETTSGAPRRSCTSLFSPSSDSLSVVIVDHLCNAFRQHHRPEALLPQHAPLPPPPPPPTTPSG